MDILVTDQNGWSKKVHVDRSVARIGSMPGSDVLIPRGSGQHTQFQAQQNPVKSNECDILCIAGYIQIIGNEEPRMANLYQIEHLLPFERIVLAGHTINIEMPTPTANSNNFSAELILEDPSLRMGKSLIGTIKIKNFGQRSSCQFKVELSGLPNDCYQIEPIPLMYANAEETVAIRFFHHGTYPKVGQTSIQIKVTSENSYPEEEALLEKVIKVEPVFAFDLEIIDDFSKEEVKPAYIQTEEFISDGSEKADLSQTLVSDPDIGIINTIDEPDVPETTPLPSETENIQSRMSEADPKVGNPAKVFTNTNAEFWNEDEL